MVQRAESLIWGRKEGRRPPVSVIICVRPHSDMSLTARYNSYTGSGITWVSTGKHSVHPKAVCMVFYLNPWVLTNSPRFSRLYQADWMTDQSLDWVVNLLTDRLADWPTCWFTDRSTDCRWTDSLTDWLTCRPTNWFTDPLTELVIDWPTRLTNPTDWLSYICGAGFLLFSLLVTAIRWITCWVLYACRLLNLLVRCIVVFRLILEPGSASDSVSPRFGFRSVFFMSSSWTSDC